MWDLPGPGIELTSPALAGGFFTTEPPGKPHSSILVWRIPWTEEAGGQTQLRQHASKHSFLPIKHTLMYI